MKQHPAILRFFSLVFLLLVVNASLVPAYAYAGARQVVDTKAKAGKATDQAGAEHETVSAGAPFHAVTNAGLQVDLAKAQFVPPIVPQVVLVPVLIPFPSQQRSFALLPYFAVLFQTSIIPNAP
jgi:hypothetical protein